MNEAFTYNWHELTKGRRLTAKLVLQAIVLAVIAGFGPDLALFLAGYGSDVYAYQFKFMIVAVPVIVAVSVISYRNNPISDVTTSTLSIDKSSIKVTRHVISETGRRFFAVWESMEVSHCRIDEMHRVIQFDATWVINAYRMKGSRPGKFVDWDSRTYPQTFQLSPESFYEAVEYLEEKFPCKVERMTPEEYEAARPFVHKHYEI